MAATARRPEGSLRVSRLVRRAGTPRCGRLGPVWRHRHRMVACGPTRRRPSRLRSSAWHFQERLPCREVRNGSSARTSPHDPAGARLPATLVDRRRAATAVPSPVTILVPARDEERHIAALLGDLGRQEVSSIGGPGCVRVIVIDDRSVDATARIAAEAIEAAGIDGCVIRRRSRGRTKGDVLRDVPAEVTDGRALLVVLDADARVAPDFLAHVAEHRAKGHAAFTARRRIAWADRFWFARLQDDEQALDSWTLAGRIGLGGGGELRGNGMVVTRQALAAAGGWPAGALTEDLELSTALLGAGVAIAWAGDVVLEETGAATVAALTRQRLRWAEGSARRFLDRVPTVLADRRAPGSRSVGARAVCRPARVAPARARGSRPRVRSR